MRAGAQGFVFQCVVRGGLPAIVFFMVFWVREDSAPAEETKTLLFTNAARAQSSPSNHHRSSRVSDRDAYIPVS